MLWLVTVAFQHDWSTNPVRNILYIFILCNGIQWCTQHSCAWLQCNSLAWPAHCKPWHRHAYLLFSCSLACENACILEQCTLQTLQFSCSIACKHAYIQCLYPTTMHIANLGIDILTNPTVQFSCSLARKNACILKGKPCPRHAYQPYNCSSTHTNVCILRDKPCPRHAYKPYSSVQFSCSNTRKNACILRGKPCPRHAYKPYSCSTTPENACILRGKPCPRHAYKPYSWVQLFNYT